MTKQDAITLVGGRTIADLARALGGITRSAVSQWPETLTEAQADRVIGAAVRLGRWPVPEYPRESGDRQ